MSLITHIKAREILDSRGNPTIEVEVHTKNTKSVAKVPSGASTGSREALELRDKNSKYANNWFESKGVMQAVDNVNKIIAKEIIGMDVFNQELIDKKMIEVDGTEFKSKLGANAILGVSIAVAKAAAQEKNLELFQYLGSKDSKTLPLPMLNILNGGAHAANTIDFQEFMIMPLAATTFKESLQIANKIFHTLKKLLKLANQNTTVGDEGGFAPNLHTNEEALDFIIKAIKEAGYNPSTSGKNAVAIALDAAASEFYDDEKQVYIFKKFEAAKKLKPEDFQNYKDYKSTFTSEELVDYYAKLINSYPIISIEDSHSENDWKGFQLMVEKFGDYVQIVGDDLIVTNPKYIQKAISSNAINSALIKMNQIGTLTETIEAIKLAQSQGYTAVISHRSGETEDTTIADLAVAFNTGQIKTGSLSRTDRIAKYNRLLVIEEILGPEIIFDTKQSFSNLKVQK
ncbi:phosphopyruvate hydratase [Mycoplasma miroungirhinis]|uniref:Enolase n=1 Tax=Mycoplasma miroungirhinis TaxID=754516 RepID=A0A6M4JDJ8_9MOLU|nr:phosphopyruvate hydratase [Mycoplasma miroungirhinis]QJR44318.1 phosphopyruvate hydratase [Mycoplasma miroungirhinis]